MTQIEDLVRQALAATPAAPSTTDPLAALDRRVRRARRRMAAGAGAVAAAIVAAVVVPLAVLDGNGSPNSVGIVHTPTPTPSPLPSGTTALWTASAAWATTDSSGRRWLLYADNGQSYVTQLSGGTDKPIAVQSPADYIVAGDHVIWVIGSGSGAPGDNRGRITAIDTSTGKTAELEQPQVSYGAAVDHSLYVTESDTSGAYVARIDFDGNRLDDVGEVVLRGAQEIVASGRGHVWVHVGDQLTELTLSSRGFTTGKSVQWGTGALYAPTLPLSGQDGIWAYGGRLIALDPSALSGCVSCAEGDRVFVPGHPSAVTETKDGLFVAVPGSGLLYYSPDALGSGSTPVTASIRDVQVVSLTADPVSGVDYVDGQGNLIHWDPAAAGAR
jgi:hypothetical protein